MVMSLCPRFLAHPVGAAVKVHSMCITAAIVRMRNSTLRCGSNLGPLLRRANHSATATCRPHTHPSTNRARRRLTSFVCRTTLSNTSHRQPRHMKESTTAKKEIFLWQAGYSPTTQVDRKRWNYGQSWPLGDSSKLHYNYYTRLRASSRITWVS